MCLSQLDREVSAVCRKINYLHPPPFYFKEPGKPFNPRFGEGGWGELPVTRQPLSHLPRHAKISHLPLEAGFTRYTAAFKSLLSRIHMENKTSMKTQENYVALGKCDAIILLFPLFGKEEEFRCLEDTELYWKRLWAESGVCVYVHRGFKVTD